MTFLYILIFLYIHKTNSFTKKSFFVKKGGCSSGPQFRVNFDLQKIYFRAKRCVLPKPNAVVIKLPPPQKIQKSYFPYMFLVFWRVLLPRLGFGIFFRLRTLKICFSFGFSAFLGWGEVALFRARVHIACTCCWPLSAHVRAHKQSAGVVASPIARSHSTNPQR